MDIQRKSNPRRRLIKRIVCSIVILAAIAATGLLLKNLNPSAPNVDQATVWIDSVKRGPGTLVVMQEHIRWIPAAIQGRVEHKFVQPGAPVQPDTILLVLSNPQLEQETLYAEWDWKAAQAAFEDLKTRLESQQMNQEAETARIH